ncbi:MAG: exonuclease SbcCD subunit D [Clostridia bacterium]|nr:exonuclease SbcCD subunit D [Clostridia bacterium]
MKLIHLSDLHLGKRLHETTFIEDQEFILEQIIGIIKAEQPDGVLIAGDVYDKSMPSAEAVALFDAFLVKLASQKTQVFIISGNHDSPERIAFGAQIMDASGIHLSPVYSGQITPTVLTDEHGEVNIYMLPFIKPTTVRRFFDDREISSYTDAVKLAIDNMNVDRAKRNVLITHQFVTGATRSESEENVGGTDNVDASVFDSFDYVALGHLHAPQNCGSARIRYSGTPLKYSFSEANDKKSVTVVTLTKKGEPVTIETIPLKPLRDMRKVRGSFDALLNSGERTEDYVQITLTDEDDIPNAMDRLQAVYKNALELKYDNTRTRTNATVLGGDGIEEKSAYELFNEFFIERNNAEMSPVQSDYVRALIEKIEGEDA